MAHADPATVAAAWASRMGQSSQKATAGANAVTTAPQAAAAAAGPFWQMRVSSPQALAKFQASLRRQTIEDWRTPYIQKGIPRMGSGAQQAVGKFTSFLSQFLPFLDSVTQKVRAMPKGSLDQNIARMEAQVRGVAAFVRSQ